MKSNIEFSQNHTQTEKFINTSNLINWLEWTFFGAVLMFFAVLGLYWVFLGHGRSVSLDPQVWGTFGDYVGGVLNPFFSFLALLALLQTIRIQNLQLEISQQELKASREELRLSRTELAKTAEAAQKQAEHLEGESKRIDLHRIIEKLAERINRNYNENRLENNSSIHKVMCGDRDPVSNPYLQQMLSLYENKSTATYNTIRWIEKDLDRLAFYIQQYERVSQYGGTPIPEFYRSEFCDLVTLLHNYDMVLNKDIFYFFSGEKPA